MRGKGITYDVGFINKGTSSREPFDIAVIKREMAIIRDDLHCTAVRITGGDPERIDIAAGIAAEAGLEVWFSPFTCDLTEDAMLALLADCAERAERLRERGAAVVLVLGAEISLMNNGFLPGATIGDRIKLLSDRSRLREAIMAARPRIKVFLDNAVTVARARFGGKITYAAIPFEGVDWTRFDIVSLDLYRTSEVADQFADGVRALVAQGKPAAITEFGLTTYQGAADKGARSGEIVVWDEETAVPLGLDGEYIRDEGEQAAYIRELIAIFAEAGVDSAFVFTFAQYAFPHRADPREDLDIASYGIVKVFADRRGDTYPDMAWEPKAAFAAVADCYRG